MENKLIDFLKISNKDYQAILKTMMEYLVEIGIPSERIEYIPSLSNDYIEIFPLPEFELDNGEQLSITVGADEFFQVIFDTSFLEEDKDSIFKRLEKKATIEELKSFVKNALKEIIAETKDEYQIVINVN